MGSKNCMNEACRTTTSSEWTKGWSLKCGGFATLCYKCGSAYESSMFCETFHLEESGWRECRICGKHIHCGCIASRYLHEFLDFGGVGCISCEKQILSSQSVKVSNDFPNATFVTNGIGDVHPLVVENKVDHANISTERLLHLTNAIGSRDIHSAFEQLNREESFIQNQESTKHLPNFTKQNSSSPFAIGDNSKPKQEVKDMYESLPQPSLSFSLTAPLASSTPLLAFPSGIVEGSERSKGSLQQGQSTRHILPKPPKSSHISTPELQRATITQKRYARPPADGRGRTQLLPRYWPRITDQELQQLSGDLKSTIVPLFEKILSASDAGRIGRLVLPKACAEAYFPPINQSEGIPIRIQDIKGKEWTFQFRFWPNNNSRMYVLEGVTPCIQNMQMQAGDTVTFSRRDPGGQLVIGCRKATNNIDEQDPQTPAVLIGDSPGESLTDNPLSNGGRTTDDSIQGYTPVPEKKMRNIKNKRLLMHSDDAFELKITWEEAQELLRPSPAAKSTVVMVEDHEFEEFEEPPIFGKRTLFATQPSGEMEQLAQCDSCSKWRRLPVHALLSAKWTCIENIWDSNRCSCSAPEDINPRDLDSAFGVNKVTNKSLRVRSESDQQDYKKRRILDEKVSKEGEPCGLDALATAAVLGDNMAEMGETSTSATTRHPRHRPGCTCIVCIQPPSGKGKHEPSCKCNVCLTVKRRFKTLMMRKKKRQSEREAEISQMKDKSTTNISLEVEEFAGNVLHMSHEENEINDMNMEESNKGGLDLNSDPHREDDILLEEVGMSLTTLMNAASLPVDLYFGQNHPQNSEMQYLPSRIMGEGEENGADEAGLTS